MREDDLEVATEKVPGSAGGCNGDLKLERDSGVIKGDSWKHTDDSNPNPGPSKLTVSLLFIARLTKKPQRLYLINERERE